MAQHMSEDEVTGLRELFKSMDTDGNGTISVEELREGLACRGIAMPPDLLDKIMDMADVNHNKCLDYEEFVAATLHVCKLQKEEKLLAAFKVGQVTCAGGGWSMFCLVHVVTLRRGDKSVGGDQAGYRCSCMCLAAFVYRQSARVVAFVYRQSA